MPGFDPTAALSGGMLALAGALSITLAAVAVDYVRVQRRSTTRLLRFGLLGVPGDLKPRDRRTTPLVLLAGLLGYALPPLVLRQMTRRRREAIDVAACRGNKKKAGQSASLQNLEPMKVFALSSGRSCELVFARPTYALQLAVAGRINTQRGLAPRGDCCDGNEINLQSLRAIYGKDIDLTRVWSRPTTNVIGKTRGVETDSSTL